MAKTKVCLKQLSALASTVLKRSEVVLYIESGHYFIET